MNQRLIRGIVVLACVGLAGLCGRVLAQANPGLPFYGYGSIVADPSYPVVNEITSITVTVGNTGTAAATDVQVKLSFNDWGVTFMGWQEIGTRTVVSIPAGGTATAVFDYVFENRAHTCLEALIVDADENADPNDDRGQINLEVIHAGESFSYGVPVANHGDAPLDLLVLGHARGGADGAAGGARADPIDRLLHLEPGDVVLVPVVIDLRGVLEGEVTEYQVDAFDLARPGDPHGREHVLLRVVRTTAQANKEWWTDQMARLSSSLPQDAAADQFRVAVRHLQRALNPRLWVDENHVRRGSGARVFAEEGFFDLTARKILPLLPYDAKVAVEEALRALVDCDRILAQTALADADNYPYAAALFAKADALRLRGDRAAIAAYGKAWHRTFWPAMR